MNRFAVALVLIVLGPAAGAGNPAGCIGDEELAVGRPLCATSAGRFSRLHTKLERQARRQARGMPAGVEHADTPAAVAAPVSRAVPFSDGAPFLKGIGLIGCSAPAGRRFGTRSEVHCMDDMVHSPILAEPDQSAAAARPLIVDLDGSLVRTDTSLECIVALASRPLGLLRALAAWRYGRARVKQELATAAELDPALLPYNPDVLAYLRKQQAEGRIVVLATGADCRMAAAVAQHLDLFDAVLASDGRTNLTGQAKLAAIRASIGDRPFTYVGNSRTDLAVWREADGAVCVNARPAVARAAARATAIEGSFARESGWLRALLQAIRPYQWAKNLLVFVPLVAARAIGDIAGWGEALLMFVAFCCTASGIYLINDLLDLAADRQHPNKSRRPFASGSLPLEAGLIVAPVLMLIGFALSAAVGALPLMLCYAAGSCAYSLWLKSHALVDVFLLAALYGMRLLGGGIATGYHVSLWLLAFSSFLFLGLALVKRVAEADDVAAR